MTEELAELTRPAFEATQALDKRLETVIEELSSLDSVIHALVRDVAALKRRVDAYHPETHGCSQCGRSILKANARCGICGHQN